MTVIFKIVLSLNVTIHVVDDIRVNQSD